MERESNSINLLNCEVGKVAIHEEGHATLAETLNIPILSKTVEPEGNTAGKVKVSLRGVPILRRLALFFGGYIAESRVGINDHSGCGADLYEAKYLAGYASKFLYEGKVTADHLLSEAYNLAQSLVAGPVELLTRAAELRRKKVVVY